MDTFLVWGLPCGAGLIGALWSGVMSPSQCIALMIVSLVLMVFFKYAPMRDSKVWLKFVLTMEVVAGMAFAFGTAVLTVLLSGNVQLGMFIPAVAIVAFHLAMFAIM